MKLSQVIFLLLASLAVCCNGQSSDNRTELHIAFITSFEGEYDSSVTVPAVQLATERVNREGSILPGYKLVVELIDNFTVARSFANSKCNRYDAQRTFLNQITSGQPKVALIGCGCSLATEPVAEISRFWNITHISYTPTSDYVTNRNLFPTLWRTHPQESHISSSLLAILRQYNWTKLKVITQQEDLFLTTERIVRSDFSAASGNEIKVNEEGVTTFFTETNVFNLTEEELFPNEIRVYFLNMYPVHARRIMCRAAQNHREAPNPEHHYPGFVWITLGWYQEDWWRQTDSSIECDDDDLELLIRNTLSIQLGNSTLNSSSVTDVGLTANEFEEALKNMSDYEPGSFSSVAYLAYDAIWTLAMGIDRALPNIAGRGLEPALANFNYRSNGTDITQTITNHLSQADFSFTGVSGEVRFDVNGSRLPSPAKIFKYRRVSRDSTASVLRELIAMDNGSMLEYLEGETDNTTWPDGTPSDGTPIVVLNTFYMPIYVIYDIFVVLGLIFATVCLLFNFIFRKRKIVRLISPNLNYFIIFGAMLIYISVAFFVFPTTNPTVVTFACHFRAWAQALGYFMCFGTIVAKMWRVYFIFHHPQVQVTKQRQRAIKDWHLMMIVLTLCTVVIIFFTAVSIFGDYKANEVQDNERRDTRNEDNVLHDSHTLVCEGPRDIIWIIAFMAYIFFTQLFSVVLAIRTRKVKIKALNDAKYVALIIYITTVIIITMMVCTILLRERLNADGAVFGGLLYIFTTVVLSVMFIPKMVILYNDPKGEKIFERTYSVSQATATNHEFGDLEKHCKELENRLGKYETVNPYYRSGSQSSIRKFSSSTQFLASLPPSNGPTPSSPMYNVNPTLSLPVTPVKHTTDMNETKLTNGTSGYLSDSPPSDKGKQLQTLDLEHDNARAADEDTGDQQEDTL